ncbi:MAG: calcium-translocating P-type ATPase, PMCA-type [Eubacteriales bacterium]|nr:calcium-translocating P-type ATPase, PMCA-type [Eubacteriales bacterium]
MKAYLESVDSIYKDLQSSEQGLSSEEASKRFEKYGPNKLKEAKKEPLWKKFLKELSDPMIIMLIAAAVVSGITSAYAGESMADVVIIMIVVVINAVLGVYQENKAEKAIDALEKMTKAQAKVIRNGEQISIDSEKLVPGDVIVLEAGDQVPADARVIESASMKAIESALTGESVAVSKMIDILNLEGSKDIPLGDRKNMVYMGSTIDYGRGMAVVTGTGMDTEMGKIADALQAAEDNQTPLQRKLAQLSKILTVIVLGICVVIFGVNIFRAYPNISSAVFIDTFMIAVSLAVAAIPEGLAAVVTIVLSIGVTKMSEKKAVIRKLTAVETLGCTQVICSDKTGTLTQNKMTVVKRVSDDESELIKGMALCSDAVPDSNGEAIGEATECALVNDATKNGFDKRTENEKYPRAAEAPFDSMRKMMSVVVKNADGKLTQYTKGAPDEVLKCCTKVLKNGQVLDMSAELMKEISAANKQMADEALRVLALAKKTYDILPQDTEPANLETELCYVGLCGMIDPIRPEVKDAIAECHTAGIRTIMITGDHKDTAVAIAKQLGILGEGMRAITGAELNEISDEDFEKEIKNIAVYARVQPEHKVRIVKTWQKNGMITAMTGDGVNDAPSIKNADIGIGMGITGTDVTKGVADMVLADDNFATIVSAVEEGRRIYDNIRKAIQFLLASNLAEVVAIFVATLLGFQILEPVHLLWINLITDCFPAIALGMEAAESDIMKHSPRDSREGIFAGGMGFDIFFQGVLIAALTVVSYLIGDHIETGVWQFVNSKDGMTMAFLTLSMVEIFHSLNMRSRRKSLFGMKQHNTFLFMSMFAAFLLTTAVIYIPFLSKAFDFAHISLYEYGIAMLLAISVIPIMELVKLIQRKLGK